MMILAVAQPRFPTNHPDVRQGTYCPVVVSVLAVRFSPEEKKYDAGAAPLIILTL